VGRLGAVYRYNSPHEHTPVYHIHEGDVLAGDGAESLIEIDLEDWPNFSQVFLRFGNWYYTNLEALSAGGLA